MLRGEFRRADGLVIPNNVTIHGARTILAAALCNIDTTFFVGLVDAAPDPELSIESVVEPTIGVNGYGRIEIERSSVGWPTEGAMNGERWLESGWLTFVATGEGFDKKIRRLMLVQNETNVEDDVSDENLKVLALSSPLPSDLEIKADTPLADRRFKYRLYLR